MDLFSQLEEANKQKPLAETMRPKKLWMIFRSIQCCSTKFSAFKFIKTQRLFSLILWELPDAVKLHWQGL